jgi:hypothetical protein
MAKLTAPFGLLLGAAVWLLLFVILGMGLGTAFIAGGVVAGAGPIAAAMLAAGPTLDAPLSATGLLLGVAAFLILRVVLSVPIWIDIVSGLGVTGLYAIADAAVRRMKPSDGLDDVPARRFGPSPATRSRNGHDSLHQREPVGAH